MVAHGAPRALSLDIWGTLVGSDPSFKPARNEMLRAALVPAVGAAEFDAVLRAADRDADERCMSAGRDVGFAERVDLALSRLDAAPVGDRSAYLMEGQAEFARRHPPRPLVAELPGLLMGVGARMPVALTSNTGMLPGALMRELLRLGGFQLDEMVLTFSDETGDAKPSSAIFAATVRGLGVQPGDVLHIGDNPVADVRGARDAGLQALLVAPDGRELACHLSRLGAM